MVEKCSGILDFVDRELAEALVYHMRNMGCIFRLGEEEERATAGDGARGAFLVEVERLCGVGLRHLQEGR